MVELPRQLRELGDARVNDWWRALEPASREELAGLWARARRGVELHAVLVDEELARENALWTECLYEYISGHEELRFFMQERSYHICHAHLLAREVARSGVIPRGFVCPRSSAACPFAGASALGGGRTIHLVPIS